MFKLITKHTKHFENGLIRDGIWRTYCKVTYIQGQVVEPKIREYFYYIDHEGMVIFV